MFITDNDGTSWLSGKITPSGLLEEAFGYSKVKISNGKYEITHDNNTFVLSKSIVLALLKESGDMRMALKMCVALLEKIEEPDDNETLHACKGTLAYARAVLKYKLSDHSAKPHETNVCVGSSGQDRGAEQNAI
ncbi:MAG TPA: hypothetical protein VGJ20_28410 [Xanthobacteraceae bacterium]|jgi:hypothetical protein